MTKRPQDVITIQHISELFAYDGREFITQAYFNLLGREPDLHGMAYYLGRLSRGADKAEVIAQLAQSEEYHKRDEIIGLSRLILDVKRAHSWPWSWFEAKRQKSRWLCAIENSLSLHHSSQKVYQDHLIQLLQQQQVQYRELLKYFESFRLEAFQKNALRNSSEEENISVGISGEKRDIQRSVFSIVSDLRSEDRKEFLEKLAESVNASHESTLLMDR